MFHFCKALDPTELGILKVYYEVAQSYSAIVPRHGKSKRKQKKQLHGYSRFGFVLYSILEFFLHIRCLEGIDLRDCATSTVNYRALYFGRFKDFAKMEIFF